MSTDWHSTREQYEQYTSSQHRVVDYCSTCDSNVGSATYESHSLLLWQLAELQRRPAPAHQDLLLRVQQLRDGEP